MLSTDNNRQKATAKNANGNLPFSKACKRKKKEKWKIGE